MKVYRVMKAAAVFAAVCGLAAVFVASDARAQQIDVPPGQEKKIDPNNGNNGGLPPGQVGNENSNRKDNCNKGNARGCSGPEQPIDVTDIEDGDVLIIDCLLPQYKNDPLCYIPAKKPAKRKVVSVKLDQNELAVTPPAATPAPAPAPAPVAPASVTNSSPKSSSTLPEANDIGSTNFQ